MDNKCIGVFDSGLGGLTAVKQIINELPKEDIIYFGDTGRVPYGSRSKETLLKYTRGDIRFLNTFDVKIIVIACGTASSAALPAIKDEFDVPIIGVIDAAVYAAVRATKNKKIGVIGTAGTIKSGEYEKQIKAYDSEMQTFAKACPMFVPLVENGYFDTEVTRIIVAEYLEEIRNQGVDTLILGCTHYPLIEKVIREYMGDDVTLINSGAEVAKYLKKKLTKENLLHDGKCDENQYRYYVSDDISSFEELGGIFLEREINGQLKNTDNEYRITVSNRQTIDSETDTIEETAYGNYTEKNGKQYITYKTENDGDKISSMIKIDGNEILIKRTGSVNSSMTYKVDTKKEFLYHLPYGTVPMEIETQRIVSKLDENGGTIELVYTLMVQGEKYFNDMKITVSKR